MLVPPATWRRLITVLGVVGFASACSDAVEPVTVASVEVTSLIGALLDVGGSAQLSATAKNPTGEAVSGVSFTWTSSNATVASISTAGFTQRLDVGTATLRADVGSTSGSLLMASWMRT